MKRKWVAGLLALTMTAGVVTPVSVTESEREMEKRYGKKIWKQTLMLLIVIALTFGNVETVLADNIITTSGEKTLNVGANDYEIYGDTVKSYLTENADGTFTRTEYDSDKKKIIVEIFSDAWEKIGSKSVRMELTIFGGFYSGKDANYFVFGDSNTEQSNDKEVMRVVKYSKDYKRISAVSIKGANTYRPFNFGSLRLVENDGKLYIHTCHTMYTAADGLNHQANMTFIINQEKMIVEDSHYNVEFYEYGYVSHSFNQFIKIDENQIYMVDHGDAYPRGIPITKFELSEKLQNGIRKMPITFNGEIGDNFTGCSIGGFELSANHCLIVGNTLDLEKEISSSPSEVRNIFLNITDKEFGSSKMIWLTKYEKNGLNVGTPQLVKFGKDQFLIMWEEIYPFNDNRKTRMVTVDAEGNKMSDVVEVAMPLSDCQPIECKDGLVRWYVTDNSSPIIYAVNPFDLKSLVVKGDLSGEGSVDIDDVQILFSAASKRMDLTDAQKKAADVNGDGTVDISDVQKLFQYTSKRIDHL